MMNDVLFNIYRDLSFLKKAGLNEHKRIIIRDF